METNWIVVISIAVLLVGLAYRLRTPHPVRSRAAWTVPSFLLISSVLTATFCLGLAWRYYWGQLEPDSGVLNSWLPIATVILAVSIIFGIFETWFESTLGPKPIQNPYLLLETTASSDNRASHSRPGRPQKLARRGMVFLASLVLGWSVTAYFSGTPGDFIGRESLRTQVLTVQSPAGLTRISWRDASSLPSEVDSHEGQRTATDKQAAPPVAGTANADQREADDVAASPFSSEPGSEELYEEEAHLFSSEATDGEKTSEVTLQTEAEYLAVVQVLLGVKARVTPHTTAAVITVLPLNQEVVVLARTVDSSWLQIQLTDAESAWIYADATARTLYDREGARKPVDLLPTVDLTP